MLERSIQYQVHPSGFQGFAFIEKGLAPYGVYVHEGHHSWQPDRFLINAFADKTKDFIVAMTVAIGKALKKAGVL
jgi:hypothetical protein